MAQASLQGLVCNLPTAQTEPTFCVHAPERLRGYELGVALKKAACKGILTVQEAPREERSKRFQGKTGCQPGARNDSESCLRGGNEQLRVHLFATVYVAPPQLSKHATLVCKHSQM